ARMYTNLCAACEPLEPASFLKLDDRLLKECGFSRQKMVYARGLAEALLEGSLDLDEVGRLPDEQAIERLCRLKGIGPWSAQNYLLWSHGRRDIFPSNDLALMIGWQWLAGLDKRPSITELDELALAWRPRRTAAAFLIWHYYLATRAGGTKAVATQPPPN
ncbi:MAG: DNA-3-methyladenine glycosylase 2 family protein, partial [Pseudomonadota bacterium]